MCASLWPSVTKDLQVEKRVMHRRNQLSFASSELNNFYETCFNKCVYPQIVNRLIYL